VFEEPVEAAGEVALEAAAGLAPGLAFPEAGHALTTRTGF
jgi:hypothetical protein